MDPIYGIDVLRLIKRMSQLRSLETAERGGPGNKPATGEFYCFPRWLMLDVDKALGIPPPQMSRDGGKDIPL